MKPEVDIKEPSKKAYVDECKGELNKKIKTRLWFLSVLAASCKERSSGHSWILHINPPTIIIHFKI